MSSQNRFPHLIPSVICLDFPDKDPIPPPVPPRPILPIYERYDFQHRYKGKQRWYIGGDQQRQERKQDPSSLEELKKKMSQLSVQRQDKISSNNATKRNNRKRKHQSYRVKTREERKPMSKEFQKLESSKSSVKKRRFKKKECKFPNVAAKIDWINHDPHTLRYKHFGGKMNQIEFTEMTKERHRRKQENKLREQRIHRQVHQIRIHWERQTQLQAQKQILELFVMAVDILIETIQGYCRLLGREALLASDNQQYLHDQLWTFVDEQLDLHPRVLEYLNEFYFLRVWEKVENKYMFEFVHTNRLI
ncbi:hypothetical protein G9P44_001922 [Scheffersomyces stipitis]|nr:hypothetical protein G9P44_001922 [Scheffersomyces stipitis]